MQIWHQAPDRDAIREELAAGAAGHMGIEFCDIGDDYLLLGMQVRETALQPYGILHGGVSCLLAETVGSHASGLCLDLEKHYCVGLEINANHIRAVSSGWVYGKARPLHLGRSTHVWDIRISDEQDRTVCVSRLTMLIKSR